MVPRAMFLVASASAVLFYGCDGRNPLEPRTVPNSVNATVKIGSGTSAALNTTATASSTSRVDVTWQDNATDETRFEIHRSTAGPTGTFTLLASTGPNVVAYSDQGLGFGQYCYKVRGVRVNGRNEIYSLFSNTACATLSAPPPPPPPPPAAPSNAQAYAYSTRISLGWQDNSSDETKFEVHRSTTGDAGTFTLLTSVAANIVALSDTGLASAAQYCYKVRAVKVVDTSSYVSAFSNTVCATTPAAPATAPPAPSDLDAWPASSNSTYFQFTASTVKTDGFRLYRSTDNGATWTNYWTATGGNYTSDPPMVIMFADDNRQPEERVCYRVISYNATGDSPPSNVDCTTPPAGPTGSATNRIDDQTVDFSWVDNSSVENGYHITAYWNSCTSAACNADNVGTAMTFDVAANSTSFRCSGCQATLTDEETGKTMYFLGFEIYATSDGGRSNADWGPAP
jgi:titin